jgi:hypothetical protein
MSQFIIVTDPRRIKHRLNVAHIVSFAERAPSGGTSVHLIDGVNIEVTENVEAVDQLIQNIDRGSIRSGG